MPPEDDLTPPDEDLTEAELRAWDSDLIGSLVWEPRGVPLRYMEEALPPGLGAQWLQDAERRADETQRDSD